ncbi:MAG: hypothetical protein P8182_15465 [Deltaproteobacteria bacterium]
MWELILISIIVLAALVYLGSHYSGKLRGRGGRSSDGSAESTACSGTCDCGLESCPERLKRTRELMVAGTKCNHADGEPSS